MRKHHLRLWEGGSSPYVYWQYANMMLALKSLLKNRIKVAEYHLTEAARQPDHMDVPVSRLGPVIHYFKGVLKLWQDEVRSAKHAFKEAVKAESAGGELKYFAGLAYKALGSPQKAENLFRALLDRGEQQLNAEVKLDFFNPFARMNTESRQRSAAYYLKALGYLGLGQMDKADATFREAQKLNPAILGFAFRSKEIVNLVK
jgi:tetratricopeptide (TPR) repeat protein